MTQVRFELTPLTPIHVGSGESLVPFEYVIDGDLLYRFSLDAFMLELPPEAQARFVEVVEESVPATRGFVSSEADVAKRVARFTVDVSAGARDLYEPQMAGGEAHPEILSCIRTNDRAYLPGSSLKGALRTALLYHAMDKGDCEEDAIKLERRVFQYGKVQEDPFRAFKVGDGDMLDTRTRVRAVGVQVRRELGWSEKLSVLVETLPGALSDGAEVVSRHAVTFDAHFYRYHDGAFPLNVEVVLAACREFHLAHLEAERQVTADLTGTSAAYQALAAHAKQLPDNACLVRLAWGSGRNATTVAYGLEDAYQPRSRRITSDGFPLGWAELALYVDQEAPPPVKVMEVAKRADPKPERRERHRRRLAELRKGMILDGIVCRVWEYVVFVDIGLENEGRIHRKQMGTEQPRPGDRVRVEVIRVEAQRDHLALRLVEVLS